MAHGFLTPTPVTGESPIAKYLQKKIEDKIEKESKKLWDKTKSGLSDLYKKLTKAKTTYRGKGVGRVDVTGPKDPVAGGMLPGIKPKGLLSASNTSLAKKDSGSIDKPEIDPVSGNRLPPSGGPTTPGGGKGGSFVDIGGSQAKPLNAENFFSKAVNEGIDVNTGKYLSKEARIAAFQAGKVERSQSEGPAISADSGVDIVAAVNRNTQMIVSLVDAVKTQTSNDSKISQDQIQSQRQLMMKSAAAQEEAAMEQGNDLSGFMTPENFAKRKKNEKKKEENDKGSKLKEFFKGPNPYKQPEACGCSPILGGPPGGGGGFGGIGVPDFVDQKRKTMGRPSRLGGGASAMRRGGGARGLTRIATKVGGKGAGKAVAKGLGKGLLKKIPGVGVLAGGAFAAERAMKGDWLGAGGELLSGVASLIPGIGTAVSTGIDAGLMARDAGLTPFANGGIVTNPVAGLVGEAGNEGIFPLEGTRGKKTFKLFGEGVFQAQKDNDKDFAKLQSMGLKQYYEREGGFKKMAEGLKDFFAGLGGAFEKIFNTLTGGAANAGTLDGAADYLGGDTSSLASFIGGLESGNDYTKMVGGKQDASVLGKTIEELAKEKGEQFAMGRYQIQMRTARDVLKGAGIDTSTFKFDQAGQDKIFELLLKRRGLDDFMSGKISKDQFAQNLSKEWAALPTDATGRGFYDGVGTNKSLTSYSSVLGQLDSLKASGNAFAAAPGTQEAQYNVTGASKITKSEFGSRGFKTKDGLGSGATAFGHTGRDVGLPSGTPLSVVPPGTVIEASTGHNGGYGNFVAIKLDDGRVIKSNHHSKNLVKTGDRVGMQPDGSVKPFALVGSTGLSTGPHMHLDLGTGYTKGSAAVTGLMNPDGFILGGGIVKGGKATKATVASKPQGAVPPDAKATQRQGQGGLRSASRSTPGSLQASAANANDGTTMMATSQQVAMGTMGLTTGGGTPTIINNYYGGGGQQGGVNSNAVFPGIGMEQTGTTVFQELKMRALA